jgi:DNA repair exonuclease SbcCD ATPase subunit
MGKTITKIDIPEKAHIRVDWEDYPENRTIEARNRVKSYFAKKYGVAPTAIKINFIPIIKNKEGKVIDISDGLIENIMDQEYQRKLFAEWLKRNDIKVDFARLCKLDDQINEILMDGVEEDFRYRRWEIKKLWIDNFLSYGDGNELEYKKLKGLNVVKSEPANQGGKTIFSIDALLFLFFGKTTKTDVALENFNQYRDKNEVTVGGLVRLDGQDYIIERKIKRKAKKKGDGYTVTNSLEFYRILADGNRENLEGEQRRETENVITETIGTYEDFMTTIVATRKNLEDLIETKPTQRGRLLTKFVGLEVIEKKEDINKKKMSEFKSSMKSNIYNLKDLESDIEENEELITTSNKNKEQSNKDLTAKEAEISVAEKKKEKLLAQKIDVDEEIEDVNPQTLQGEIDELIKSGVSKKKDLDKTLKQIKDIGDVDFDEDAYNDLVEEQTDLKVTIGGIEKDITSKEKDIKQMKEGEICSLCKQPLKDVDHTEQIESIETEIHEKEKELEKENKKLVGITKKVSTFVETKKQSDDKDKLELVRDRLEVEMEGLRVDVKEKKGILKSYQRNLKSIETNRDLESKILGYNQLLTNLKLERDGIKKDITDADNDIKNADGKIKENKELIKTIKKETEVLKIFEIYHKMIGKNGISKMVLSSVIPIINYELQRLLDDVCDFEVELNINDKNEVEFLLIKSGKTKKLKSGSGLESTISSLALRCVLGRISTLPKPNVIVFDEILGTIADVNLDNVKLLFDKLKTMYDIILFITHNPVAQDWADKIITVVKKDDISTLNLS